MPMAVIAPAAAMTTAAMRYGGAASLHPGHWWTAAPMAVPHDRVTLSTSLVKRTGSSATMTAAAPAPTATNFARVRGGMGVLWRGIAVALSVPRCSAGPRAYRKVVGHAPRRRGADIALHSNMCPKILGRGWSSSASLSAFVSRIWRAPAAGARPRSSAWPSSPHASLYPHHRTGWSSRESVSGADLLQCIRASADRPDHGSRPSPASRH